MIKLNPPYLLAYMGCLEYVCVNSLLPKFIPFTGQYTCKKSHMFKHNIVIQKQ